jgi:hypothetical protein
MLPVYPVPQLRVLVADVWQFVGLPRESWFTVPPTHAGSKSTQCATPEPISDHFRPAGQFAAIGALAHAPGVSRQRASAVMTPLVPVDTVMQLLVSNSSDSTTLPSGHVFVDVLYFDPTIPGPHSVTVDWIGMLYGVQIAGAVCARVVPLTQNASKAMNFATIFKDISPFFKVRIR